MGCGVCENAVMVSPAIELSIGRRLANADNVHPPVRVVPTRYFDYALGIDYALGTTEV